VSDQKPSVGRIVHVPAAALQGCQMNGADVAPAVITRVWSDNMVNVRVLLDGNDTPWKTSIALFQTPEACAEASDAGRPFGCYWPPRV
jgi:hypothetical protein